MASSFIGVAHVNLKEVTSIIQLGDNLSDDEPIFFGVVGTNPEGKQSIVVLKVDSSYDISVFTNTVLD